MMEEMMEYWNDGRMEWTERNGIMEYWNNEINVE